MVVSCDSLVVLGGALSIYIYIHIYIYVYVYVYIAWTATWRQSPVWKHMKTIFQDIFGGIHHPHQIPHGRYPGTMVISKSSLEHLQELDHVWKTWFSIFSKKPTKLIMSHVSKFPYVKHQRRPRSFEKHQGQLEVSILGVPPVIIHSNGIFHETNRLFLGYPHDYGNPSGRWMTFNGNIWPRMARPSCLK